MDMDTRIKLGIIGKLKVSTDFMKSVQIPHHEVGDRYVVRFLHKERAFHLILSWGTISHIKMVALIRPNLDLNYWTANDDHTQWRNI